MGKKKKMLGILAGVGEAQTAGKIGESIKGTIVNGLVAGAVGGAVSYGVIGPWSFLAGLAVTGLGMYTKKPFLTFTGVGMMGVTVGVGIGKSLKGGVSGLEGETDENSIDGMKERFSTFQSAFTQALLPMKKQNPVSGLGDAQYYDYGQSATVGALSAEELKALDTLEQQIERSGVNYAKGVQGTNDLSLFGEDDELQMTGHGQGSITGAEDQILGNDELLGDPDEQFGETNEIL